MSEYDAREGFAGTPEQVRAWNAQRRAYIASKRRAVSHLRSIDTASGCRRVNSAEHGRVSAMGERDG